MSRYPTAEWDPIPENATQPKIRPTQFIIHRQAGLGELHDYYAQQGIVVESHLWVAKTGRARQYLDTTVRGDANLTANKRPDGTGAVSCEFEGGLHNEPLTPEQVATAIKLLRDARTLDGVPLHLCPGPDDPGVGWHIMFGSPGPWTPVVKTCPTKPVIAQIPAIIAAAQEDDMQLTDKIAVPTTYESSKATGGSGEVDVETALRRTYEWAFLARRDAALARALAEAAAKAGRPLTATETAEAVRVALADSVISVDVGVRPSTA